MTKGGRSTGLIDELAEVMRGYEEWARELLCQLITFRSTTGAEAGVQEFLHDFLRQSGIPGRLSPLEDTLVSDPDYTPVPGYQGYRGRPNVLVSIPGTGGGRSAIVNTHTDVVPGPDELFAPSVEKGTVHGRGACDAKGQVVTVLLALSALREQGIRLRGNVEAQFVIEEEAGGNGSLAAIVGGGRADVAIVLEPTGLGIRPSNRGAVWFKLAVSGSSVHMGHYHEGVNAIDEMTDLVAILKEYEDFLRKASRGYAGFPDNPSPVVVNVGRIQGGEWPSTVPGKCIADGAIAFLPNRTVRQVEKEVRDLIKAKATPWAREHSRFDLGGLRNEAFETPARHPAVQIFQEAAESVLGPRPLEGWLASCDGRLFYHRGKMPTIVFGAGDLRQAHALDEQVKMEDILRAAEVLARFLVAWCGAEGKEERHAG